MPAQSATGELLEQLATQSEALSEEYTAALNGLLTLPADGPTGELAACAAASWAAQALGTTCWEARRKERSLDELLAVVTQQVCALVSLEKWHVGLAIKGDIAPSARAYGHTACQSMQRAQQRISQAILAPILVHMLLSDDCINIGWLMTLDARADGTGERAAELAQVFARLAQLRRIDERYAVIAAGLALLAGPGRSPGDFQGITAHLRGLRSEAFIRFVASVFAESFAAYALEHCDPIMVAHAAMRLVNGSPGDDR